MILQKKIINNVPTLVPLTADTGSGVPVGTIIGQYKKVDMAGYLYLDGSTFDQTLYPALYAYLGTNVLPDYREFVLVGAEQNTTSTTIAVHDVFTQGAEKDDQLQEHTHEVYNSNSSGTTPPDPPIQYLIDISTTSVGYSNRVVGYNSGRRGDVTRTKEKAVFWYIKATTGIIESEATEMLNVINENNSYSLNEIATGKTWIDGKPIYRIVLTTTASITNTANSWGGLQTVISNLNLERCIYVVVASSGGGNFPILFTKANGFRTYDSNVAEAGVNIIFEYTKTTD